MVTSRTERTAGLRNFEEQKDLSCDLNREPASDGMSDSNLVNVASLQFAEESLRIHLSISLPHASKWFKRNACKAKPFRNSWQRCPATSKNLIRRSSARLLTGN